MRSATSSLTMKVLLTALILSFISFYGWSAGQGCNPHTAARVNGENISLKDLDDRFQSFIFQYRQMGLLKDDTNESILASLRMSVLQGLIQQRLKLAEASRIGLVSSDEAVRDTIKKQFSDSEGNFDFDTYKKVVTLRLHRTPGIYEKQQADSQVAQLYDDLLSYTSFSTTPELRTTYELRNARVNLEYVELDREAIAKRLPRSIDLAVANAALEKYFREHEAAYKIPEKRQFQVAWVKFGDLVIPTEADLLTALGDLRSDPGLSGERIHAQHILVRTAEDDPAGKQKVAEEIYRRVTRGEPFEAVAQAESEDSSRMRGGDLGWFGRGQMVKEFDETAFALKPGQISKPVKTQFGFHVIRVLDRIPAGDASVARLKRELEYRFRQKSLEEKATQDRLSTEAQRLLNEVKERAKGGGALKAAIADPRVRYLETGFVGQGDRIPGLDDDAQLIRLSETLTSTSLSEPIRGYSSAAYYLLRVGDIRPAAMPSLESVRAKVAADLKKDTETRATREYVLELLNGWMASKQPLSAAAKKSGFKTSETGDFARATDNRVPKVGVSESTMAQAFRLTAEKPYVSEPVESAGKFYLLALKSRSEPDWATFEKDLAGLRSAMDEETGRARVASWVENLHSKAKIQTYVRKGPVEPTSPDQMPEF